MSESNGPANSPKEKLLKKDIALQCGMIMPISAIDGASADHWAEVKSIIEEAVTSIPSPTFVPRLVSDSDEIGVIQKRIIQNLYTSSIVICDVSGKNPNVMFELGLRLAFDKPTVIIKDDKTEYSFDTSVIEQIAYPRDLRFARIVEFKKKLAEKVSNTYKASLVDQNHSPFLKAFGEFHSVKLQTTEATPERVMVEMLEQIQRDVEILKRPDRSQRDHTPPPDLLSRMATTFLAGRQKLRGDNVIADVPLKAFARYVQDYLPPGGYVSADALRRALDIASGNAPELPPSSLDS